MAFLKEFPAGAPRLPLRMRCTAKGGAPASDNKRSSARSLYQDVIEFFPNQIEVATSAIYYRGKSFEEDGDVEEAVRTWGAIAHDKHYRQLPIAADALLYLGKYLLNNDRAPDAVQLLDTTVSEFRTTNATAATAAIDLLLDHFVRHEPNEEALAQLYLKARGFGSQPMKNFTVQEVGSVRQEMSYWSPVLNKIKRLDNFSADKQKEREAYLAYWLERLEAKPLANDEYQMALIDLTFKQSGNEDVWVASMMQLHQANQGDHKRTLEFMAKLKKHPATVRELYRTITWAALTGKQAVEASKYLFDRVAVGDLGPMSVMQVPLESLVDDDQAKFAKFVYGKKKTFQEAGPLAMRVSESIDNEELRNFTLLNMFKNDNDVAIEKKLAFAEALSSSQKYSADASKIAGDILKKAERYSDAIAAYRAWGKEIESNYMVADCHFLQGNINGCIAELQMLEVSFAAQAAPAALKMARYYDKAGMEAERNATLFACSNSTKAPNNTAMRTVGPKISDSGSRRQIVKFYNI